MSSWASEVSPHKRGDLMPSKPRELRVMMPVVVRDAHNQLQRGQVAPVPPRWRDRPDRDTWTTKGDFPKCWVWLAATGHVVPWPLEDVFTETDDAMAAVRQHGYTDARRR